MDSNLKLLRLNLPLLQVLLHLLRLQTMLREVVEVLMVLYPLHLGCRKVMKRGKLFIS